MPQLSISKYTFDIMNFRCYWYLFKQDHRYRRNSLVSHVELYSAQCKYAELFSCLKYKNGASQHNLKPNIQLDRRNWKTEY